jgi:hypothetical protein
MQRVSPQVQAGNRLTKLWDSNFGVQILYPRNDIAGFQQVVYPASVFHYGGIIYAHVIAVYYEHFAVTLSTAPSTQPSSGSKDPHHSGYYSSFPDAQTS